MGRSRDLSMRAMKARQQGDVAPKKVVRAWTRRKSKSRLLHISLPQILTLARSSHPTSALAAAACKSDLALFALVRRILVEDDNGEACST